MGRQLQRACALQLPVQNGSGPSVENIALKLKMLEADFLDGEGATDLPGPGAAQCAQIFVGERLAIRPAQQHLIPGCQNNP